MVITCLHALSFLPGYDENGNPEVAIDYAAPDNSDEGASDGNAEDLAANLFGGTIVTSTGTDDQDSTAPLESLAQMGLAGDTTVDEATNAILDLSQLFGRRKK